MNIIGVQKQGKNNCKELNIRRYIVQDDLIWLQRNNPAYGDITICDKRLSQLPIDGPLDDMHFVVFCADQVHHNDDRGSASEHINPENTSESETHSCVTRPEPALDSKRQVEKIIQDVIGEDNGAVTSNRTGHITIPCPSRDNKPVSEFTTDNFFTLASPCLFPYGAGDFHINRPRTCTSMAEWADHLLWYSDGRFAHHEYFQFIIHNMPMRKRSLVNRNLLYAKIWEMLT